MSADGVSGPHGGESTICRRRCVRNGVPERAAHRPGPTATEHRLRLIPHGYCCSTRAKEPAISAAVRRYREQAGCGSGSSTRRRVRSQPHGPQRGPRHRGSRGVGGVMRSPPETAADTGHAAQSRCVPWSGPVVGLNVAGFGKEGAGGQPQPPPVRVGGPATDPHGPGRDLRRRAGVKSRTRVDGLTVESDVKFCLRVLAVRSEAFAGRCSPRNLGVGGRGVRWPTRPGSTRVCSKLSRADTIRRRARPGGRCRDTGHHDRLAATSYDPVVPRLRHATKRPFVSHGRFLLRRRLPTEHVSPRRDAAIQPLLVPPRGSSRSLSIRGERDAPRSPPGMSGGSVETWGHLRIMRRRVSPRGTCGGGASTRSARKTT